jgi:hypothetical protein
MSVATLESGISTLSLVERFCESLSLDLRGARVITESASGPFAVTAAIAAFAGARVEAIAADSQYGSARDAASQTVAIARELGVADRIQIVSRTEAAFELADIVTNLGSVRPLDQTIVSRLQPGTVIPVMYDARELRANDIDLDACRERGVRVVGTFEEHPNFNIFRYIGPLALKLIEDFTTLPNARQVALVGNDLFAPYLIPSLESAFSKVVHLARWEHLTQRVVVETDLFIFSDYCGELGSMSDHADPDVLKYSGKKQMLQFTGGMDSNVMGASGWRLVPSRSIESHRMFHTLAYLGMEPVVELHACGLKTAEIVWKSLERTEIGPLANLCQIVC